MVTIAQLRHYSHILIQLPKTVPQKIHRDCVLITKRVARETTPSGSNRCFRAEQAAFSRTAWQKAINQVKLH